MFDSTSRNRVRGLVLAAVCAAALGLAACGDDDDDDAATDTSVETTETTDTGETTTETTDTGDTSDDPGVESSITDQLRSQLEAAGAQPKQADCVIEELEGSLSEEELREAQEAQSADEIPQKLLDASTNAAQKCLTP